MSMLFEYIRESMISEKSPAEEVMVIDGTVCVRVEGELFAIKIEDIKVKFEKKAKEKKAPKTPRKKPNKKPEKKTTESTQKAPEKSVNKASNSLKSVANKTKID